MKNQNQTKAPNKTRTLAALATSLAAIAATLLVSAALSAHGLLTLPAQAAQERTILSGITIDGIDVAGMTKEQAKARIDEEIAARESAGITLVGQGEGQQVRVTPADLGIRYSAASRLRSRTAAAASTERPSTPP